MQNKRKCYSYLKVFVDEVLTIEAHLFQGFVHFE